MKALKNIFLINAIIEMAVGLIVLINPRLLLFNVQPEAIELNLSKAFGIAIFIIGVISYQLYKHEFSSLQGSKMIALAMMAFHLMIAFTFYSMYNVGLTPHMGVFIFHIIIGIIMTYFYSKTIGFTAKNSDK